MRLRDYQRPRYPTLLVTLLLFLSPILAYYLSWLVSLPFIYLYVAHGIEALLVGCILFAMGIALWRSSS